METRVQVASHFKIDPAKQTLGAIEYPDKVTVTLSIGDELIPSKVDFDVAFSAEQRAEIEEKLNTLIIESGKKAQKVSDPAYTASANSANQSVTPDNEEEGESLF